MSESAKFFRFQSGALVEQSESTGEPQLAVADSWLSVDGKARSLRAHFDRFADWTAESAPELLTQLPDFFEAVEDSIRVPGRLFPRIELHTEGNNGAQLFLRIREAPDQLGSIKLWSYPQSDPRQNPLIKGPDLSLCLQMRRNAQMHGADEAVITDARGNILEGALSAIVWWRDDILCAPGDELPWLDSITRREVFSIAEQMGMKTRLVTAKPADLVGLEVWALSSLQGIRVASEWVDLGGPLGKPKHFESFERRLRLLSTAI
ncbi:MAG: hypothetical protein RJB56_211 [Actinomycetota bacterium]|jgi:branched-subunit amino acid aminotransferase/4-amino-4-deoxychorismate lyase